MAGGLSNRSALCHGVGGACGGLDTQALPTRAEVRNLRVVRRAGAGPRPAELAVTVGSRAKIEHTVAELERRNPANRGSVLVGVSALTLIVGGGLLGTYLLRGASAGSASAMTVEASEVDPGVHGRVTNAAEAALDRKIDVNFAGRQRSMTLRELGMEIDEQASLREAKRLGSAAPADKLYVDGPSGGVVPVQANREVAAKALLKLKRELDRGPRNARLDLEGRKVHKAQPGLGIDVYGSISAIEAAARRGAAKVEIEGVELPAEVTVEELGIDDVSSVLASFKTRFSVAEKSRNSNLKLAASRLNGHVLKPGELFSFNETVGARSEREGYKVAHVITSGEMVDGLAGGACQISTTLHGAAFFSGIEIVSSTPHSRPSTYVAMGLDATVAWPNVDLKLRNNFDFPVVIHFRVARGESVVEILGRERMYDEVAFERAVGKRLSFDTITREDSALPVGSMMIEQNGFPGYKLKRYRKYYKGGKLVKTDSWNLRYRPVTEYVRLGINPDPNLPPPRQRKGHGPRPPRGSFYRLAQ